MKRIPDKYLALWVEHHEREAKRRSLSADEESFLALVRECQVSRTEIERSRPVVEAAISYVGPDCAALWELNAAVEAYLASKESK